ncbi:MAG: DNA translocase FtsK 4TM domain-containing protein [Alphaproteobacteria bacterium]|nr:DNA translocase FtsK 4TM domain-containing protein [Alphaproteobacteria bacterium]
MPKPRARTPISPAFRLGGLVLGLWVAFAALSLLGYYPADPSLNRSSEAPVMNWAGYAGAITADLMLQITGLASLLLVFVPLAWAAKFAVGERISYLWMRACLLPLSLVLSAALLSSLEPPLSWPIASGLGGAIGGLAQDHFAGLFRHASFIAALLVTTISILLLTFGLSASDWLALAQRLKAMALLISGLVFALLARRRRDNDDADDDDAPDERLSLRERFAMWRERRRGNDDDEEDEDEDDTALARDAADEEDTSVPPSRSRDVKVARVAKKPRDDGKKSAPRIQAALALPQGEYELPPLKLLATAPRARKSAMSESALTQNAKLLEGVLQEFGVHGEITEIRPGPVVTLYELEPEPGTRSSRVIGLSDDIARSMSAVSARIAVIPGRNAIGIELPNSNRETVYFREMLENEAFEATDAKLPLALGKDIGGAPIIVDLARMPHLLVAGTTGSGKSVAINTMIMSLVYRLTPNECKFIMIDPKMLELSGYEGIPHLLTPVVTEPGKAVVALKWTVKEMENRYRLMSNLGVKNIDGYNKKIREAKSKGHELTRTVQTGFNTDTGEAIFEEVPLEMTELPFIVVVVDEMADLMIVAGKEIEGSIQRLAQMARAAGIHIIMATQRPSVDVITGVIKANFPTRISFQVTSRIDSRTILGEQGADQLLGQGDMLYMAGGGRITRVHGPFVSDKEVEEVVAHLKAQGSPTYIEDVTRDEEAEADMGDIGEKDELYDQAVKLVMRDGKASTSYIQRCLRVGYNRAASIIELMEREGIVGPMNHVGKREVLARHDAA